MKAHTFFNMRVIRGYLHVPGTVPEWTDKLQSM